MYLLLKLKFIIHIYYSPVEAAEGVLVGARVVAVVERKVASNRCKI